MTLLSTGEPPEEEEEVHIVIFAGDVCPAVGQGSIVSLLTFSDRFTSVGITLAWMYDFERLELGYKGFAASAFLEYLD